MVVRDLDFNSLAITPDKAQSVLVIDSDAVLPLAVPLEGFQVVSWWHLQVIQGSGLVQVEELSTGNPFNVPKLRDVLIPKKGFGAFVFEGFDHE
jgi:hypothetical protein